MRGKTITVSAATHGRLCQAANQADCSLAEMIGAFLSAWEEQMAEAADAVEVAPADEMLQ